MIGQGKRISPPPIPVSLAKLLLVEGDTPAHFFEALLRHLKLENAVEIRIFGGVGDFRSFVVDLAKSAEFKQVVTSVGAVRDAENQPAVQALQSVQDSFTA